ncbi:MAG TPA: hypothetical protein VJQ83_10360 [Tepidiformaceae bacterium]|nr:hypothetical protein [Tepidiformaceae bacterium]
MDFELSAQAHLADLQRLAESARLVDAASRASRHRTSPGRLERLAIWLFDRLAWPVPPANRNSDPWYPWWWDG